MLSIFFHFQENFVYFFQFNCYLLINALVFLRWVNVFLLKAKAIDYFTTDLAICISELKKFQNHES